MSHDPYKALYIHIPFCSKRCLYCDFNTRAVPQDSPEIDAYIEDLCLDIRRMSNKGELNTIETLYIGGGTPTFVGMSRLSPLLYTISASVFLNAETEYSMEANPESLSAEMCRDMYALGVNRLSIGVQSFDDEVLRILGRVHSSAQAQQAIAIAQERFENVSIDLMCAIPGQSDESFEESISVALNSGVTHVSIYPLTIEPHTPFDSLVLHGRMQQPDGDLAAQHMQLSYELLTSAGFERYEVASYARPGCMCRHNISYWTGVPYVGIGKSAVTMTQDSTHRMRVQDGVVIEDLTATQMRAEDLMLRMRMTRGLADEDIEEFACTLPKVHDVLRALKQRGLLCHVGGRWMPTERGWLCGNELYGELFDLAP